MKTIFSKKDGYKRVSDLIAAEKVKQGAEYVGKEEYKKFVKNAPSIPEITKDMIGQDIANRVAEKSSKTKFKKGTKQNYGKTL